MHIAPADVHRQSWLLVTHMLCFLTCQVRSRTQAGGCGPEAAALRGGQGGASGTAGGGIRAEGGRSHGAVPGAAGSRPHCHTQTMTAAADPIRECPCDPAVVGPLRLGSCCHRPGLSKESAAMERGLVWRTLWPGCSDSLCVAIREASTDRERNTVQDQYRNLLCTWYLKSQLLSSTANAVSIFEEP